MTLKEIYTALKTKYRKHIVLLIGAIVLFIGASWVFKACDLKDGYSVLAGEYKAMLSKDKAHLKAITVENLKLAKDIASRDEVIEKKNRDIAAKQNNINNLSGRIVGLSGDLANAKTDAERVPILTAMVDTWTEKYNVLLGVVADKDKVISQWESNFADQQKIATNYRIALDAALDREDVLKDMNTKLSNQLRVARLGWKLKSGLVLTALAVVVYGEIKK